MDRRSFLKTSALGGSAAAATTLPAPAYAQGNRTLTMVTTWGRGLAGVHDAAQRVHFADDGALGDATHGRVAREMPDGFK